MHRRKWTRGIAALVVLGVAGIPQIGSAQSPPEPTLRLFAPNSSVKVIKYGTRAARLYEGIFVSAENGPFEVRLTRPDYTQPVRAEQVIRTDAGTTTRPLPEGLVTDWFGAPGFFTLDVVDATGVTVLSKTASFCPNGDERQRADDTGPAVPTYPSGCYGQPFTKGFVWGIDRGWAVNPFSWSPPKLKLADGTYTLTVGIADAYRDAFGFPENSSTSIQLTVKTRERRRHCRCVEPHFRTTAEETPSSSRAVPTMENPDPSILPDLEALPAWGISVNARKKGDFLSFGATEWVGGASSLVVEGFRRQDEAVMDAWQYFYDRDGEAVGRAPVGAFEYDDRRRHNHWHFLQFVAYRLLDADKNNPVLSTKEAFCLAPTDAVDLSLENAVWNTGELGLYTSCGSKGAIWIRETLPLGWGDTYFQGLPGQSFDITDLPNGTYYIEVEANPDGLLFEQRTDNNSQLREVILKGKPGARRVIVPPWNGIDTENGYGGYRRIH